MFHKLKWSKQAGEEGGCAAWFRCIYLGGALQELAWQGSLYDGGTDFTEVPQSSSPHLLSLSPNHTHPSEVIPFDTVYPYALLDAAIAWVPFPAVLLLLHNG